MGKRDYFRNGTLEMIALSLLSESDLYGYQLVQTISERSGGVITIQIGSLSPVLYRLQDDGYISETQVPIGWRKFCVYCCSHDLRHTFAVNSLKSGDDIKTVQENLGHHTAAFTLDTYARVTSGMKKSSASRMDQYIKSVTTA